MRTWGEELEKPQAPPSSDSVQAMFATRALTVSIMAIAALMVLASSLMGQVTRISDVTVRSGDVPFRLVGYGLVSGLDGSGDRVTGSYTTGPTVRSVANLLRRFDVEVPENMLRTRNVAAVLVTAEVSPYLRPGGRFTVHIASIGDATSLRGGVLWMTPLQAGPGSPLVATAQGALMVSEGNDPRGGFPIETTVTLPDGGLLEQPLPTPDFAASSVLYLRQPDLMTAMRVADAINASVGDGTATVDDPGSVTLQITADATTSQAQTLAEIGELTITPSRRARVIIDGRAGTVIAGGDISVGEAVVSHGAMTLAIGGAPQGPNPVPGDLRMNAGATVQDIAGALHSVAAPPESIAAVFESLREVGALTAEVTVR